MLTGNNALNNSYGIQLYISSNNTLSSNNANSNNGDGISMQYSSNNTLSGNNANLNNGWGINLIFNSSNNTLSGNNANSNYYYGIGMGYSNNNKIYNNFFNNTNNFGINNSVNRWNTTKTPGTNIIGGSYLGGNVWANPSGTGFSQTCTDANSDGICDSPYTLNSNNTDYLPLVYKWLIPGDVTGNGVVDAIDSMFIAQYVAGTRLTLPQQQAGDVASPCGSIDAIDSMFVAQYVAGTRPSLQLCS
jgi:parallel beta-helix repeat protein